MTDPRTRDLALAEPNEIVARRFEVEALERMMQLRQRLEPSRKARPGHNPREWERDTKFLGDLYQRQKRELDRLEREGKR